VQRFNQPLYRAYLRKQYLPLIFQLPIQDALELLERWLEWAFRCRLEPCQSLTGSSPTSRRSSPPWSIGSSNA